MTTAAVYRPPFTFTLGFAIVMTKLLMRTAAWYATVVWPVVPSASAAFWLTVAVSALALRRVPRLRPVWRSFVALAVLWLVCIELWTNPYPTRAERVVRDAWAAILGCLITRVFLGALGGSGGSSGGSGGSASASATSFPVTLNVRMTVRERPGGGGWTVEAARA